jgi:hypothetical protein
MRTLLLFSSLAMVSCSYTFDGNAPEAQLVGTPPDMTKFPRLNNAPVKNEGFIYDPFHGNFWFWMYELPSTYHAFTVPGYGQEDIHTYDASQVQVFPYTTGYLTFSKPPDDKTPVTLTIQAPGQPVDATFMLPPGQLAFGTSGYEVALYYWVQAADTKTFHVFTRDGVYARDIPIPKGVDPTMSPDLTFTGDSAWLIARDADNRLISHSTISEVDVDLGIRPKQVYEVGGHALVTIGMDGVRRVPLSGAAETVLDPQVVDDKQAIFHGRSIYYSVGGALWSVLLDGTGSPQLEMTSGSFQRVLGWAPDGTLMFSTDPAGLYIYNAGDGWLGNWNFMERGRGAFFNSDGTRVRWLEHAAQTTGVGDLLSAPIGGTPVRLARNVAFSEQLDDGRMLALANYAEIGSWNRIIAIDEQTNTASWIATGTSDFTLMTSNEMVVDVVTGATGHDVLRVPIPPDTSKPDGGM